MEIVIDFYSIILIRAEIIILILHNYKFHLKFVIELE